MQAIASLRPDCHLYPCSTVALPIIRVQTEVILQAFINGCWRDSGLDIVLFVEVKMLKTEENKWKEEEMKSYSNFQPKHITDQDKHIFSVWEWHCLSAVVTHSFCSVSPLQCFGAAVRPSFTFPHSGSAPQLAGLPLEEVQARMSWWLPVAVVPPFTLCYLPGTCLSGSRAGHCPSLLALQQPSPPTLLFLTRTGVLIRFTPWPPASANRNRLKLQN